MDNMTDIYDIKDFSLWMAVDITNSIIFILIAIIFYIYLKNLSNKNIDNKLEEIVIEEKIDKKNYISIIEEFQKEYLWSKNSIFYSKLIEILRDLLESKWYKNISKMTYDEMSNLSIDDDIKNIISSIYFKEYVKEFTDSKTERENLMYKIKWLI